MHRHLALAFLLLPLHLACDDSSSSSTAAIPRQETTCLDVEGPAPCCEIPTFAWVEANCPEGSKYMEGVHMGNGNTIGKCVTLDSEILEMSASAGPSAQVSADGIAVSWSSRVGESGEVWSCNSNTGRLILRREGSCPVECYDDAGFPRECGSNPNCD